MSTPSSASVADPLLVDRHPVHLQRIVRLGSRRERHATPAVRARPVSRVVASEFPPSVDVWPSAPPRDRPAVQRDRGPANKGALRNIRVTNRARGAHSVARMYRAKECFALAAAAVVAGRAGRRAGRPAGPLDLRAGRALRPAGRGAGGVGRHLRRGARLAVRRRRRGTSVVQVSKTGAADRLDGAGSGAFDDTEGITSLGGGQFVLAEERERRVNRFTYAGGGTLTRDAAERQARHDDRQHRHRGRRRRSDQRRLRASSRSPGRSASSRPTIDWAAGTATNGSPTTENSTNLFDPALAGVTDFADVFAHGRRSCS